MPYEEMLRVWKATPDGNHMLLGEVGEYFWAVMKEKRKS